MYILTFCQQMQVSIDLHNSHCHCAIIDLSLFLLLFFSVANNFQINVSLLISEQSLVLSCVDVLHIAITCLHCKYVGTLHTAKLKCGFHYKSFILNAPLVSCPIPVIRFGWVCCCTHPERMTANWATDQSCI